MAAWPRDRSQVLRRAPMVQTDGEAWRRRGSKLGNQTDCSERPRPRTWDHAPQRQFRGRLPAVPRVYAPPGSPSLANAKQPHPPNRPGQCGFDSTHMFSTSRRRPSTGGETGPAASNAIDSPPILATGADHRGAGRSAAGDISDPSWKMRAFRSTREDGQAPRHDRARRHRQRAAARHRDAGVLDEAAAGHCRAAGNRGRGDRAGQDAEGAADGPGQRDREAAAPDRGSLDGPAQGDLADRAIADRRAAFDATGTDEIGPAEQHICVELVAAHIVAGLGVGIRRQGDSVDRSPALSWTEPASTPTPVAFPPDWTSRDPPDAA